MFHNVIIYKRFMSSLIKVQKLSSVNFFDLSPSFNTTVHQHNDWELLYVDSGEINFVTQEKSNFLKQGDVVFHHPNETHSTVCNGKKSASIFNIHFVSNSPSMEYFMGKSLTVSPKAADTLKRLIDECNATYRVSEHPIVVRDTAPFGGEQMTELLLEEFLLLLVRDIESSADVLKYSFNKEKTTPQMDEICKYLKDNVYGRLTLEDLTIKFHFSKSFLCEHFKKCTGLSPIAYYLDLKLTEAKRLLREDDLTINEIAERLGFESLEYFSRYFKKRVGRSPREFRKMLINDASLHKK